MLIQFYVRNFKTFKDRATLSLIASNYDKQVREAENIRYVPEFNLRLVKSAVIYGANASGKSKLIEALMFMKRFAIDSSKETQKGDYIEVEPFKLQTDSESDSTEFEVIFIFRNEMFRYGFEVTQEKIVAEWLYHRPNKKEVELFFRQEQKFEIHPRNFSKGNLLVKADLIRENALMLSVAAQFNDKNAAKVLTWFYGLKTISGLQEEGYQSFTMGRTEDPSHKEKILALLKAADLGIQDISLELFDVNKLPKEMPKELREVIEKKAKEEENTKFIADVLTTHRKYDSEKNFVESVTFSLEHEESSGTKKFFALTGPVLDSIENGFVLIVDELDSKLHPNLVCKIVSLFNSKELNSRNAQLIFNTHDTNLLNSGLFRRDQIWFTEKDRYGAAKLYSLADFKSDVRNTEKFEDNYIRGKYGAIPYLADFESWIDSNLSLYENEK